MPKVNAPPQNEVLHNRNWLHRILEILPGLSAWLFILSPIILSFVGSALIAYIIIAYDLIWVAKIFGNSNRLLRGYYKMRRITQVDWQARLSDLGDVKGSINRLSSIIKRRDLTWPKRVELLQYRKYLRKLLATETEVLDPKLVHHAVIISTINESMEILEPTVEAVVNTNYPLKKIWLVIAYEERGGKQTEQNAKRLISKYGKKFGAAFAIKHPAGIPGEIKAKAGNISYAAKRITEFAKKQKIDPAHIIVTTLDADNRAGREYFANLTFTYTSTPERIHKSYQPMPLFLNNIWDVPAAMRVVATWNSFWVISESMRPHRLRNFSAHAQSLQTLIDTNYWNVRSIVEDGHQFWRTYYTYSGNHQAVPIFVPVYQDAVLADSYFRTFRGQFVQLRRWAWGSSDIAYVFVKNLKHKEIPWTDKWWKFFRLYEGFFTWATASMVLAFAAWTPLLFNANFGNQVIAHQLPVLASYIMTVANVGIVATVIVSLLTLPPRPLRYKRRRHFMMLFQWALLPFVAIFIHSMAALNAMTRLMLGKYLEEFDVTEKVVKS